jgi:hypothetical protein
VPKEGAGGSRTGGGQGFAGVVGSVAARETVSWVAVWMTFVTLFAMLVTLLELVCETAPLSPGLNTRIEMFVLHVAQGGGECALGSQSHRQSQIHVVPAPEGVTAELDCPVESPQPHVQVQTHVKPASADGSAAGCAPIGSD